MPLQPQFQSEELTDSLFAFPQGMNAGTDPNLIPRDQLGFLINGTLRGDFPVHRCAFRKMTLSGTMPSGLFQGAGMFNPLIAPDCLVASISGNIVNITPGASNQAAVTTLPTTNPSTPTQVWMFQTERWLVINDGQSAPIFYDGVTAGRSNLGGYLMVLQNVNDPNVGNTYTAGTSFRCQAGGSAKTLFAGHIFNDGTASYNFPTGLAAGSAYTFYLNQLVTVAVGSVFLIGPDLWQVQSTGSYTVSPLPSPTNATKFTAVCVNAITAGTAYANGTSVLDTQALQLVGTGPQAFVVPNQGNSATASVSAPFSGSIGSTVFVNGFKYTVLSVGGNNYPGSQKPQLPPGKMGCEAGGRTWMCLPDGKSYIASDLVGDQSSGTANYAYTDAVLNITENTLLANGGAFRVPGNTGSITAMVPTPTLDASLGQGPIQIFTPTQVFSCNAPTDRTTWTNLTYPIQSVSLLGAGALSQWSSVPSNSDTFFRSLDGIRSLVLARRDFNVWGNVPYSEEVEPLIVSDNPALLPWSSAIVFDNRLLMTNNPQQAPQGVYHNRIIALNLDPVSSLAGKAPSIYDGLWTGLNILQLVTGTFNQVQRAFAFVLNPNTTQIELWEILPTPPDPDYLPLSSLSEWSTPVNHFDNSTIAIPMEITFPMLDFGPKDPRTRKYLSLNNGEISVDHMSGTVLFQVYYQPDDYPYWTLWAQWTETSNQTGGVPDFRPRMGLGTPSASACDPGSGRPLREGYMFQVKLIITGNARFKSAKFSAVTIPEPKYKPLNCAAMGTPGP